MAIRRVRVLVVDDSAIVRRVLMQELSKDPGIEVIGGAADPYEARDMIVSMNPDILTLDVEMPRMDGITFLRKLMDSRPMPVIVVSSFTAEGTQLSLDALEAGAVDVVEKPSASQLPAFAQRLAELVKAAGFTRVAGLPRRTAKDARTAARPARTITATRGVEKIICIGASTGGTEALRVVLEGMPANSPPILIVQHMPPLFTKSFADRLNNICPMSVAEAEDGMPVQAGRAVVARGGHHLTLRRAGAGWVCDVREGPLVCQHCPSVEMLFNSAAQHLGPKAIGVIMTGMGRDGAQGLRTMKDAGARTVAQNEASCVVFGMPKEAIALGGAEQIVSLERIADTVLGMI